MEKIVETIAKFNISALLVIGGFEVEYKTQTLQRSRAELLVYSFIVSVLHQRGFQCTSW